MNERNSHEAMPQSVRSYNSPVYNEQRNSEDSTSKTEHFVNRNMEEQQTNIRPPIKRSLKVDCLALFFGIGSWIGVNATFLQLPLLVEKSPEGWRLPSYIVIVMQIGNIGPLAYTLYQKFSPKKIKDSYMIYAVQIISTIASLCTAFMYMTTTIIGGHEYSLALFILSFFLALKACTSSVLCMPYMGRFIEIYLITYLMGEGLSGFIPSIAALIQGVGGNVECILNNSTEGPEYIKYTPPPLFGTSDFYIFVFVVMILSTTCFVLLDNLKYCRKYYAAVKIDYGNSYVYENLKKEDGTTGEIDASKLSKRSYKLLLLLITVISIIANGVLPSIQTYSCLPYGNVAYHLAVTLSLTANPIACLLSIYTKRMTIRKILILTGCNSVLAIYVFVAALLSPNPPLVGTGLGSAIIVISWTVFIGLNTYIKIGFTTIMRSQGGKSLVWTGALSQAGSATGSVVTFILVNFTKMFTSYEPC